MDLDPHLNKAASIWLNPKLNINKKIFIWKEWVERGILVLDNVYSTNLFKTFDELKQDYNLPSITPCTSGGFMGQVFTPQN